MNVGLCTFIEKKETDYNMMWLPKGFVKLFFVHERKKHPKEKK